MSRYYYITPEDYETAEKNGIARATAHNRVYSYGWSVDEAITKPPQQRRHRMKHLTERAKTNGIKKDTLWRRIHTYGWSEEEACTRPVDTSEDRRKRLDSYRHLNERVPKEARETAKKNGIAYGTLMWRLNHGWSIEKATTTPPMHRRSDEWR